MSFLIRCLVYKVTWTILKNTGQYWAIFLTIEKYFVIFDNVGQFLNVPFSIKTLIRESWNSHLSNIEKYRTILGNIWIDWAILVNIGQHWTILGIFWLNQTIFIIIVPYLGISNNILSHLTTKLFHLDFNFNFDMSES